MTRSAIANSVIMPSTATRLAVLRALPSNVVPLNQAQRLPGNSARVTYAAALPVGVTSASRVTRLPTALNPAQLVTRLPTALTPAGATVHLPAVFAAGSNVIRLPAVLAIASAAVRLPSLQATAVALIRLPTSMSAAVAHVALPCTPLDTSASVVLASNAAAVGADVRLPSSADDLPTPTDPPVVVPPPPPAPDPGGVVLSDGAGLYIESVVSMTIGDVVLPTTAISLTADRDSWAWRLSATLPGWAALPLIDVDPMPTVTVIINGYRWVLTVEEFIPTAKFGERSISMSGRSPSGSLAKPTAPGRNRVVTAARTAAQLAADELGGTGWALDWELPSWLVPAHAFEYRDLAPIEAVTLIAKAAGGIVVTDRETATLHVIPRYPVKPWALGSASPDYTIAADRVYGYQRKAAGALRYSAIYVTGGEVGGVVAKVRRPGVAERLAPTVTDPLITHADAARARGVAELCASYVSSVITLTTPIAAAPTSRAPLLPPGKFLAVGFPDPAAWFGGTASCTVLATTDQAGAVTVEQSIEVERYG